MKNKHSIAQQKEKNNFLYTLLFSLLCYNDYTKQTVDPLFWSQTPGLNNRPQINFFWVLKTRTTAQDRVHERLLYVLGNTQAIMQSLFISRKLISFNWTMTKRTGLTALKKNQAGLKRLKKKTKDENSDKRVYSKNV